LPVLLAWATLDRVETDGPGSKLSREEVQAIVHRLGMALDVGTSDALGDAGLARKARPPRRRARGEV